MDYGFVKVAAAVPELRVAECKFNTEKIIELISVAEEKEMQFVCLPELSITGYTCGDLFFQERLISEAYNCLKKILEKTCGYRVVIMLGMPVTHQNKIYNCGVVIQSGAILGVVPKIFIPNYSEFYEQRWFKSGLGTTGQTVELFGVSVPFGEDLLFCDKSNPEICFGIEICEDLWTAIPPSSRQSLEGAVLTFNLSASNEFVGKSEYRRKLVEQQSARCFSGYLYVSSGVFESTTDTVFGGHAIIAENGSIITESERFQDKSQLVTCEIDIQKLIAERRKNTTFGRCQENFRYRKAFFDIRKVDITTLERKVEAHPFIPHDASARYERCREIFNIQTWALIKRMRHVGANKAVIDISGGLDSTLALLVTVNAFDLMGLPRSNIYAVTMPGFGTTGVTYNNAMKLMESLGVDIHEINIKGACLKHFEDIGHDPAIHDTTYENVQARERTQIKMDIANKIGGLAIGTGDLSELALGWCTYNGDHMSMYAVNTGVPKTLVRHMVQWVANNTENNDIREVLFKISDTPITPELLPPDSKGGINQKTEDIVGPYELHDFFLYHMLKYGAPPEKILFLAELAFKDKYDDKTIQKWLKVFYKRFFSQQYKRSCLPDGPKVGSISLSPRGDWRMPSDAMADLWLSELE